MRQPTRLDFGAGASVKQWLAFQAAGSGPSLPPAPIARTDTHLPYPTQTTTLGNVTTATVSSLVSGTTYYCAVTAYDSAGLDSPVSNEIVYQAP